MQREGTDLFLPSRVIYSPFNASGIFETIWDQKWPEKVAQEIIQQIPIMSDFNFKEAFCILTNATCDKQ